MKKMLIFGGIGLIVVVAIVLVVVFVILPGDDGPKPEIKYALEEMYTNIPVGDEEGNYKILKLQMTIIYTDEDHTAIFDKRADEITDFINGYFRDITMETVNRKNGKERVKEEVAEELIELLETDSDNIKGVIFPQFIIQ